MLPDRGTPHVFITGVAGFIGSALAQHLLGAGFKVSGLDNFSYGSREQVQNLLKYPEFQFFEADLEAFTFPRGCKPDAIVHLASLKIPRYGNALNTLQHNTAGVERVCQWSLEHQAHLLFTSTSDVYGLSTVIPFHEESPTAIGNPAVPRWSYALSKLYGEHLIHALAEAKGLRFTIARLFGTYGPGQRYDWWGGPQGVFLRLAAAGETLEVHGDGQQTRCFIYISDTVKALQLLLEHPAAKGQIVNVGAFPDEEISMLNLAKMLWTSIRPNEEARIKLVPYSQFGRYEDVQRRVPDLQKISAMGFLPEVRLNEGLMRLRDYYLSTR